MEFFKIVNASVTEEVIHGKIVLEDIELISNHLFKLDKTSNEELPIGSLWGEFTLLRQVIKGGIRYSLKECPNALTWTITTGYPPKRDAIVLHLTINRIRKDKVFIEEINEFLDDHANMLEKFFEYKYSTDKTDL